MAHAQAMKSSPQPQQMQTTQQYPGMVSMMHPNMTQAQQQALMAQQAVMYHNLIRQNQTAAQHNANAGQAHHPQQRQMVPQQAMPPQPHTQGQPPPLQAQPQQQAAPQLRPDSNRTTTPVDFSSLTDQQRAAFQQNYQARLAAMNTDNRAGQAQAQAAAAVNPQTAAQQQQMYMRMYNGMAQHPYYATQMQQRMAAAQQQQQQHLAQTGMPPQAQPHPPQ
jgi:hypothetical protein